MSSSTSCRAMKHVYSGSMLADGYWGHGSTIVSAWMHWRGAPGSATSDEISCKVASKPTSGSSRGLNRSKNSSTPF